MTTENTDAATRILTDAIRQLHELAQSADDRDAAPVDFAPIAEARRILRGEA